MEIEKERRKNGKAKNKERKKWKRKKEETMKEKWTYSWLSIVLKSTGYVNHKINSLKMDFYFLTMVWING